MKSSLKKIREITFTKRATKDVQPVDHLQPAEIPDELKAGIRDLQNMQDRYDGLFAVAQAVSGAAFDFSRSIQDLASYMMEMFERIDDGETGNLFSMLGKVQFEISKLLDLYASHVSKTIVKPTESLLKELQMIQEVQGQYEERRQLYNQMRTQRPKGKDRQLGTMKKELSDHATALGLRYQSLKLGRELNLATQAARHHTAQVRLFGRSLDSLNAVEALVRQFSLDRSIDTTLSEADIADIEFPMNVYNVEMGGENLENGDEDSLPSSPRSFQHVTWEKLSPPPQVHASTKSAPISPSMYSANSNHMNIKDSSENLVERPITRYALPTPADAVTRQSGPLQKKSDLCSSESLEPHVNEAQGQGRKHASLQEKRHMTHGASAETYQEIGLRQSVLVGEEDYDFTERYHFPDNASKGSNHASSNYAYNQMDASPTPRYSLSGPLAAQSKPYTRVAMQCGGFVVCDDQVDPLYKSGPVGKSSAPWGFVSPKISPCASPPLASTPVISELHKLPTPPKPEATIAYSAPLGKSNVDNKTPLPAPPLAAVKKSRSIPSSVKFARNLQQVDAIESPSSNDSELSFRQSHE